MHIEKVKGYTGYLPELETLMIQIYGDYIHSHLDHALQGQQDILNLFAYENERLIGCKIGFSPRPGYFESWMGGVHPDYRNQGIATQLTEVQHAYCQDNGYRIIQTYVANDNLPMLLVNLKAGLKVVGCELDRGTQFKLKLQKDLKQ